MTRTAATSFLAGVYAQQLTEAGLTATDDAANLGPVINKALLTMGTSYDDLASAEVANAHALGYMVLLQYFATERILGAVRMSHVDITLDGPQMAKRRSQAVESLQKQLDGLKAEASNYGLVTGPTWQAPTYAQLDTYEPEATTWLSVS